MALVTDMGMKALAAGTGTVATVKADTGIMDTMVTVAALPEAPPGSPPGTPTTTPSSYSISLRPRRHPADIYADRRAA